MSSRILHTIPTNRIKTGYHLDQFNLPAPASDLKRPACDHVRSAHALSLRSSITPQATYVSVHSGVRDS